MLYKQPYKSFFSSDKQYTSQFKESFTSQRELYDIVEDIVKAIKVPYIRAFTEFNESDQYRINVEGYYEIITNKNGVSRYFNYSHFIIKFLLEKIGHRAGNVYKELTAFYENHPYSMLSIYLDESTHSNRGSYSVDGKTVEIYLTQQIDDIKERISKKDYTYAFYIMNDRNRLKETLIHEFTHLYDDVISKEKGVTAKIASYKHATAGDDEAIRAYLSNPIEINARFYSAMYQAEKEKLVVMTSSKALRYQWDRVYFYKIDNELNLRMVDKERHRKVYKRAWLEFTTLDKYEEEFITFGSFITMINNGDIKKIDVRIKNKAKVLNRLKQVFIDLSNGETNKNIFVNTDPFLNFPWQTDIQSEIQNNKQIIRNTKWEEANFYVELYKHIEKNSTRIQAVVKSLRLPGTIIDDIKNKYGIK